MSDDVNALAGADSPIVEIPGSDKQSGSVRDAARTLAQFRHKQREPEANQAQRPEATAQPESGEQPEPATAEAQPSGEQTEAADTSQEETPIDPPKSWTKEAKERFASLPRDTQEYLAQREDERDRDISRRQNETAEQRKAVEAERQKVGQARQQYEQAAQRFTTHVPSEVANLDQMLLTQFPEISSLRNPSEIGAFKLQLAQTDWPRSQLFLAIVDERNRLMNAANQAQQELAQSRQTKLSEFEQAQSKLFAEKVPEFADPKKKAELQNEAIALLKDHLGFSDQELSDIYNADKGLSLRDHRTQLLLLDGIKYRAAQASAKKITANARPLPQVQRPGVSQPRGAAQHALVENLTKQLAQSGSIKDAARLVTERRKAG